jgi:uroporphyrinogen decarboxylase
MSSYEVVRRAIEWDGPERLPLHFLLNTEPSDVVHVNWNSLGVGDRNLRETCDEWGCLWVRSGLENMGQVKGHPLADWSALDYYRWPDPDNPAFYEGMEERFTGTQEKYVLTGIFMLLFERMWALHGFQNTLVDLYLERDWMEMLANRIVEFDLGIIQNISQRFPGRIHGLIFSDDWGTQQALMVSPQLWREFFKPRYRRIFGAIRGAGWHVWMHSDGKINAILDDLIEIGLDVIQLLQPQVVGIEEIGQHFRGRICIESQCDIQHTLPLKGAKEIQEEARLILEHWTTPQGGFILSIDDEDEADLNIPPEKTRTMLDAFLEADPWHRQ